MDILDVVSTFPNVYHGCQSDGCYEAAWPTLLDMRPAGVRSGEGVPGVRRGGAGIFDPKACAAAATRPSEALVLPSDAPLPD